MVIKRPGASLLCLSFTVAMAVTSLARQPQSPSVAPDVRTLGPKVGETLPDFSLPDQQGRARSLSSLMGPKGLVLVFNRSAEW